MIQARRNILVPAFVAIALFQSCAYAREKDGVTGSIVINASQQIVWESIRDTKHFDHKIEVDQPNEATVEQRFRLLPLLGETVVVLKVTAQPKERIDFKLVHSDHLRVMQGTWLLTPLSTTQTKLQLSSNIEPRLRIPKVLVNCFVSGKVQSRLQKVKTIAESAQRASEKTNADNAVNADQ